MSKENPQTSSNQIPDWMHLAISLAMSFLCLIAAYLIILIILDLVSTHLINLNLTSGWMGIISIIGAFLISFSWARYRRVKTESAVRKRNWRWSANLLLITLLVFLAFVAYRIYQKSLSLPQYGDYFPIGTDLDSNSLPGDSLLIDSTHLQPLQQEDLDTLQ